ncbi:hypothetical protein [Mesonia maritima]|uniref:Lipocalin-like domain-containing protein n=1 Tax=Mesonia maritima TaxID=1793873 RepID=A0ABU1K585_9FLAO|nr:hypothetical protein [Mesonia maritima]MDR6300761.1 hypothetical protein [Mesonia maritima]
MKIKLLILGLIISMTSCSPRIVNTWNIDKYKVTNDKGKSMTSENIGTITFKKNGKGEKKLNYNLFQNDYSDTSPFEWNMYNDYIVLKTSNKDKDSNLNKTWIIVEDSSKKQVWKSTDGENMVQILELSR